MLTLVHQTYKTATDDVNFALYKIKITSGLPYNMAGSSHMLHWGVPVHVTEVEWEFRGIAPLML